MNKGLKLTKQKDLLRYFVPRAPNKLIKPIKSFNIQRLKNKVRFPYQTQRRLNQIAQRNEKESNLIRIINKKALKGLEALENKKKLVQKGRKKKTFNELTSSYKDDFKWLDIKDNLMFCSYCIDYCDTNKILTFHHPQDEIFIKIGSNNIRRDALIKHESRELHCKAILTYGTCKEKELMSLKVASYGIEVRNLTKFLESPQTYNCLIPIFKSVYFSAKKDLSLVTCEELCCFLEVNGILMKQSYRNQVTHRAIMLNIAENVQKDILKEISQTKSIGIQIDESTDVCSNKLLTINVKYIKNGYPACCFLCIREIAKGDAETIYKTLKETLKSFNIFSKVRSISTDGARTLLSKKNGVVGKLLKDIPGLIHIHCMAHRLNLGISNAWKVDRYLKSLNKTIYSLCKLLHNSPTKLKLLQKTEMEELGYVIGLIVPIDIRWLTKFKSVKRLFEIYPFIIITLRQLSKNKNKDLKGATKAANLLEYLCQLKCIGHLAILTDLLDVIDPINNIFQKKILNLKEVEASYKLTLHLLEELEKENNFGSNFEQFLETISKDNNSYRGVKIAYNLDDIIFLKKRNADIAKMMKFDLESRFKDLDSLVLFEVFSFKKIKEVLRTPQFKIYGNSEIEKLCKKIGLDKELCSKSWSTLKNLIVAYKDMKEDDFWKLALEFEMLKDIKPLIETYLTLPLTTVECERVFSKMNLVKTQGRNQLNVMTLDGLLQISLNGPSFGEFNYENAVLEWKSSKKRYFVS